MQYEVHIYLGTAYIGEGCNSSYVVGSKYAILLFLREKSNSEYNIDRAEEVIKSCNLNRPEFTKVGKLDPDRIKRVL